MKMEEHEPIVLGAQAKTEEQWLTSAGLCRDREKEAS